MSRRDDDHIGEVPKIAPAHDEVASYQKTRKKSAFVAGLGEVPDIPSNGSSVVANTVVAVAVLVSLAAAGWAAYLHQKLQLAQQTLITNEQRLGELERRLSVTDESMSESSVAIKVKVREMDSEIRKLWDNVWKRSKEQFAEIDVKLQSHDNSIVSSDKFIANARQLQAKNDKVVAQLGSQLKSVQKTSAAVKANSEKLARVEGSLESTSDKVNRVSADSVKLGRRVKDTEEWVESINGFRRQVNRDIGVIKQDVGKLQGGG